MKNIAIIPARSGSKRLKDKNIRLLNGKPLMAYTIEAAKTSGEFDEIFVSTDSENYAKIACQYGASVPFMRSEVLASDTATSWDTVQEVLETYAQRGKTFDTFTLLQPTSPLRDGMDISAAYELMEEKNANAIVSVAKAEHPPLWCTMLPEDLSLEALAPNLERTGQPAGPYYRINGAIYIVNTQYFESTKNIYKDKCHAYVMSSEKSIDIDTLLDFEIAAMVQNKFINNGPDNSL